MLPIRSTIIGDILTYGDNKISWQAPRQAILVVEIYVVIHTPLGVSLKLIEAGEHYCVHDFRLTIVSASKFLSHYASYAKDSQG